MGLDCAAAKFLCASRMSGVDFTKTLMIGRQTYLTEDETLEKIIAVLGLGADEIPARATDPYSEWFFQMLGASSVSSLDASGYEHADHVANMNYPVPQALLKQFSVVFDGGSLEHIFNLPQALKNCLDMVQVGGHFLWLTVANNMMGHGFWQLSPDLIFRALSPENGFAVEAVLLTEVAPNGRWYKVRDPLEISQRAELVNDIPVYLLAIARRTDDREIFQRFPMQSDYKDSESGVLAGWKYAPWGDWKHRDYSFSSDCYQPVSEADLLRGLVGRVGLEPTTKGL